MSKKNTNQKEVDWDLVDKKILEKLIKELETNLGLGYDDYKKIVNDSLIELYGCGLNENEDVDYNSYPINTTMTFYDYFSEKICDGEVDDYDDEDGWRIRKVYLDIDDNFAVCIEGETSVWDYEFFDEENEDDVKIYKVKKIPVHTFRYERVY